MPETHDYSVVRWLYDDAAFLRENGRLRGCLCLLLCLIDGFAKRAHPTISKNRERYTECNYSPPAKGTQSPASAICIAIMGL